jgi:hypothetical protein
MRRIALKQQQCTRALYSCRLTHGWCCCQALTSQLLPIFAWYFIEKLGLAYSSDQGIDVLPCCLQSCYGTSNV